MTAAALGMVGTHNPVFIDTSTGKILGVPQAAPRPAPPAAATAGPTAGATPGPTTGPTTQGRGDSDDFGGSDGNGPGEQHRQAVPAPVPHPSLTGTR